MMKMKRHAGLIWRAGVCAAALTAPAVFMARDLFPHVPLLKALLVAGAFLLLAIAVLALYIAVMGQFNQMIINKGGTDAQWALSGGEPRGLQALRRKTADEAPDV